MKNILLTFVLTTVILFAQAQENAPSSHEHNIGFGIGNGAGLTVLRGEYVRYWGLGKKARFKVGAGGRLFYGFAQDARYSTVNTGNVGDGSLTENAIQVENVGIGGLNAVLGLKYAISAKLDIGFRLDLIGLGLGAGQGGIFEDVNQNTTEQVTTQAPNPNIAFTRGQVMSDNLWLGYTFNQKHQVYLSFSFLGSEYELKDNLLGLEDPRFERIHQMLVVGYNWRF